MRCLARYSPQSPVLPHRMRSQFQAAKWKERERYTYRDRDRESCWMPVHVLWVLNLNELEWTWMGLDWIGLDALRGILISRYENRSAVWLTFTTFCQFLFLFFLSFFLTTTIIIILYQWMSLNQSINQSSMDGWMDGWTHCTVQYSTVQF